MMVIVSGLALGCDTAAHKGCLQAGDKTIVVVASGLNITHPKCNNKILQEEMVNNMLIKNKDALLENKINIALHDLQYTVNTDNKWLVFILSQIVQNSIKYSKGENRNIEIFGEENKEKVSLHIKDNGIGIKSGELPRVFDKGFTGTNGRINGKKSTGIGLYLSKKLCDKLGLSIEITSSENVGTELIITFPKGTFLNEVLS